MNNIRSNKVDNTFMRQLKGFFIANLKIQLRNPIILIIGFLLPLGMIFGYQYIVSNNFTKTKVGYVSKETSHYKRAIEYLNQNTRSFELRESSSEQELDIALANDLIDVKLWYTTSGNPTITVTSKDSNNLKNKLLENVLTNEINTVIIKENDLDSKIRTKVNSGLITSNIGTLLEPILPVLLAFAVVLCCVSMNDLNIFNKKENISLRRLFAAPAIPFAYLLGQSFSRVFFCLLQIMSLLTIMIIIFQYQPPSLLSLLQIFMVVILVVCIFIQQNIILAALIRRGKALALVNSIVIGLQFLLITGFLPINNPNFYLKLFLDLLPFGSFVKIVNNITSGLSLFSGVILPNLIGLIIWFILLSVVANKSYHLNKE
jgi:ABC-type multidrug transport system permease subunit